MNNITAILNGYKRGNNLNLQYDALINQSITPDEILLWYNTPDNGIINYDIMEKIPTAFSNINMGVWARFAYALNSKSKYICIFDDDTIPGKKWFENCLTTIKTYKGILGTVGALYTIPLNANHPNCSYFENYIRFGWTHNNNKTIEVDWLGHAWFFEKEWLSCFWREIPDAKFATCGEDMHLSYTIQKYLGLGSYVPPHPANNKEMWGSINGLLGADNNDLWCNGPKNQRMLVNEFFITQRKKGWQLVMERK